MLLRLLMSMASVGVNSIQYCPTTHLFPTLWWGIPHWQVGIRHGGSIYTMGVGKIGLFPPIPSDPMPWRAGGYHTCQHIFIVCTHWLYRLVRQNIRHFQIMDPSRIHCLTKTTQRGKRWCPKWNQSSIRKGEMNGSHTKKFPWPKSKLYWAPDPYL